MTHFETVFPFVVWKMQRHCVQKGALQTFHSASLQIRSKGVTVQVTHVQHCERTATHTWGDCFSSKNTHANTLLMGSCVRTMAVATKLHWALESQLPDPPQQNTPGYSSTLFEPTAQTLFDGRWLFTITLTHMIMRSSSSAAFCGHHIPHPL